MNHIQVIDVDLLTLKPGDKIIVTKDDGSRIESTVKYPPWRLGHGAWVVGVDGISGGYSLARIERAPEAKASVTT